MKNRKRSSERVYLIGGIFSLTGHLAWLGIYKKKAAELKIKLINEKGGINGKKLKLVYFDDRSSPQIATMLVERLILREKVLAIVGTSSVPLSLAVAKIANRYKVPCFVNSGYLIDPYRDIFVFNTAHRSEIAILKGLQYFSECGIKRVGFLMPIGPLGDVGSYLGRLVAKILKIEIVAEERFELNPEEIKVCISRLISFHPHALFSFVTGFPAFWVAKTLRDMGLCLPLLLSHGNASPSFFRSVKHLNNPIFVPTGKTMIIEYLPEGDSSKNIILEFNKYHKAYFGEPANYHSAEVADAIDLICEALRTGATNPEEVKEAVEGLKGFVGMQGVYTFSENDHYGTCVTDIMLLKIQDGEIQIQKVPLLKYDLSKEFVERQTNIFRNKVTYTLFSNILITKEYINQKDKDEIERISSWDYLRLKEEFFEALYKGEEIKARILLDEILVYFYKIEDLELLRAITLEMAFGFMEVIRRISDENSLRSFRVNLLRSLIRTNEKKEFLKTIIDLYNYSLSLSQKGKKSQDLIFRLIFLIKENLHENLKVSTIARRIGISPSYLVHRVKKEYGFTVKELMIKLKVHKALTLLAFSNQSIGEIAHELGFSDQGHFTKVFKKYTKMTPRVFRENLPGSYIRLKSMLEQLIPTTDYHMN